MLDLSTTSLILVVVGLYIGYSVLQVIIDPLRDIPGPFLARFTRLWYLREVYKGSFEFTNIDLHKNYGPIVRISPNEYSIDDLNAAKTIYGHGTEFAKAPWYWAWGPPDANKTSLFAGRDPHRHGVQRRKYSSAFSMSSLVTYEPFVNECISLIKQRFSEIALADQTVDLGHWLQCYAFDVIGEITFASRFGLLDMGEDKAGMFKTIDKRFFYCTFAGLYPSLHSLIFPILPKGSPQNNIGSYTTSHIEAREKMLKDPKNSNRDGPLDFVTKFLNIQDKDPEKMTKMDIFNICQTNIAAGSDTTAISLSAIFYYLMKNPQSYKKLQGDLKAAAKESRISKPITFKEAQEVPYLQAVIKESLRLHSAVGLGLQRVVPPGGTTLVGCEFPAGAIVGINAWVAHRNKSVYGEDADKWRPERWIEFEEQGRGGEIEKYNLAFGLGSRTCVGKNISLLEISKLVPELVMMFDMHLVGLQGEKNWETLNRWFVKPYGFEAELKAR